MRTGGPEALHQLCHELNRSGQKATMRYVNEERDGLKTLSTVTTLYRERYTSLSQSADEELTNEWLIVLPEIYLHYAPVLAHQCPVLVWWLSVDNALPALGRLHNLLDKIRSHPLIFHAYQSTYAGNFIAALGLQSLDIPLSDYVYLAGKAVSNTANLDTSKVTAQKQSQAKTPIIAYNPAKGQWLAESFFNQYPNFQARPIENLSPEQLRAAISTSHAYIDFGHLPGKDRLPREALALGKAIFIKRAGAGCHAADWHLPDYARFTAKEALNGKLFSSISKSLADDSPATDWQSAREAISRERKIFQQEVAAMTELFAAPLTITNTNRALIELLKEKKAPTTRALRDLDQAERRLAHIEGSTTWQMTAPIRRLLSWFNRYFR